MKHTLDPSEDSSSENNPKRPKHDIPDTSEDSSMAESPKQSPKASEDSSMAEAAEDQSMADPSEDIPETSEQKPTNSFTLVVHPPSRLKHAIEAMSHANPEGLGILEVVAGGIRILCQMRFDSGLLCYLDLNPGKLMKLFCTNRFKKAVLLKEIFNTLDGFDDQTVEIEHADGSAGLTFTLGIQLSGDVKQPIQEDMPVEKSVTVYEVVDDGSVVVPDITPIIEAVSISAQDLMKIIQQVEADESKLVLFEMLNGTASIKVEQEALTRFTYEENDANRGITHVRFQIVQCECLKKALVMAEEVLLCLGTGPQVCLTLRFNLGELGDLVYISPTVDPGTIGSIDPSAQKPETSTAHLASASGADQ